MFRASPNPENAPLLETLSALLGRLAVGSWKHDPFVVDFTDEKW